MAYYFRVGFLGEGMILTNRLFFYLIGILSLSLLFTVDPLIQDYPMITKYVIDTAESKFIWMGSKSSGSEHTGTISLASGKISTFYNPNHNTSQTSGYFILDMESIQNTDIEDLQYNNMLVRHLKSDDFFAVDSFPYSYFELTNIVPLSDKNTKNNYTIFGNLKLMDITFPIEFPAEIKFGNEPIIAKGMIHMDRTKWGIKYKSKEIYKNIGDNYIHDIFTIDFYLIATVSSREKRSALD